MSIALVLLFGSFDSSYWRAKIGILATSVQCFDLMLRHLVAKFLSLAGFPGRNSICYRF